MIFKHTSREKDLWRGWLNNGQSVELSRKRSGWDFGGGIHVHSNDADLGDRLLFLKIWRWTVVLPLGVIQREFQSGDEPQWSAYASYEFGLSFHWNQWRKYYEFPWSYDWHRTSYLLADGSWLHEWRSDRPSVNRKAPHKTNHDHYQHILGQREGREWSRELPYSYVLKNGTVQQVIATIKVRESERRRRFLRWTRLGAKTTRSIDVSFSGEVGEGAGSWKGGTIGCGYAMEQCETPEACLRRMERERKFR